MGKLSAKQVTHFKKPGRYGDGDGLWLQVSKVGSNVTKSWLLRYMLHGRARAMGLGSVKTFSLKEARDLAKEYRQLVWKGIDPIEVKREKRIAARLQEAKAITFRECVDKYIVAHEAGWRNEKHRYQWEKTLGDACEHIGKLPVGSIDTSLVLKVLEPMWKQKPETASRLRQRIEAVLNWASARGYRSGENPARWRGHLDNLLPKRSKLQRVQHLAAMPFADVPAFMHELRAKDSVSARALEFTILTAARTGETIGATWSEIDTKQSTWIVPGERMKAGHEHRVPLSDRVLEILAKLPRERGNEYVFIGGRKGGPLSNMAMLQMLRGMRPDDDLTVHGFRSTFRDWVSERTSYPHQVAEMALAHVVSNQVEAAYRRGDLFEKRRRLMAEWARFCASGEARGARVVTLRQAKAV